MGLKQVKKISDLKIGMTVRGKSSGLGYLIVRVDGDRAIGQRTIEISNPPEWDIITDMDHK